MARFSAFLGRRVQVQYRASDTLLPASGVFVADSGRSIFLEQSFEQRGQHRHFRWEIPYQHLVRIGLAGPEEEPPVIPGERDAGKASAPADSEKAEASHPARPEEKLAAGAAVGMGLASAVLPLTNPSKIA